MEAVKTAQIGNEELRILIDEDPEDPRQWDNLGIMVCWHRRYNLGDKHDFKNPACFNEFMKENKGEVLLLNLYLYDHSGITMRAFEHRPTDADYPFNDRWDAGQVGYIYVTYEKLRQEYSVKRITKKTLEKAEKVLTQEVMTYSQYLEGDVYGFMIVKKKTCKCCGHESEDRVDSCFGFFGSDFKENGILDHIPKKWSKLIN